MTTQMTTQSLKGEGMIKTMVFTCRRCGYTTTDKGNYMRHLKRKRQCLVTKEDVPITTLLEEVQEGKQTIDAPSTVYHCPCGKCFTDRSNRFRHMKTCKNKILPIESEPSVPLSVVNELKAEVETLKRLMVQPSNSNTNVTMNVNNGTVNNINIQIRNFGQENMEALPVEVVRDCFMNLDFKNMFKNLYCDANYPENHNVKLKSKKDKQLLMYKGDQWNVMTFSSGLEELFERLSKELVQFARTCKTEAVKDCGEEEFDNLSRLLYAAVEKVEEARIKKFRKEVDQDILCALEEKQIVVS